MTTNSERQVVTVVKCDECGETMAGPVPGIGWYCESDSPHPKRVERVRKLIYSTSTVSRQDYDALLSQVERMREALNKYAAHQPDCAKWETVGNQLYFHGGTACTCGLDKLLKGESS